MTLAAWQLALAGMLAAAWLALAGWASVTGLRRRAEASGAARDAARVAALAAASPAVALLVRGDDRIEGPVRLAHWLGLDRLPRHLPDLAAADDRPSGIVAADAAILRAAVAETRRTAAPFSLRIGVAQSDRRLRIEGAPAAPGLKAGPGAVLVWMFDATATGQAIAALTDEVASLRAAADALAALIEAAPLPMWHREPDLRLGLVNSAYVRAVEATAAHEVIARGLELVEASGSANPLAAAAAAREEGRVQVRTTPATIAGERRMLRITDVPLANGGVGGYAADVEDLERARADLQRFARAQRDMLDRLSAGVAQFGPDHMLAFSNQPFQRLFAMDGDWLAERPEFDRLLEEMRRAGRLPESRDFPTWKAERRAWFTRADEAIEENWLLPGGSHLRLVAQPLPDGGLLLVFEDRTEQLRLSSARDTLLRVRTATFDSLFEAIAVFAADGRLSIWNSRFRDAWDLDEEMLAGHPRVDALVEAAARKLTNPARAGLIRELVRIATAERQQRSGRVQLTDGRHFEFAAVPLPDGNALFTMLDVTDSRRVESALRGSNAALEEADRVKTAFVAGMSYELRTPLTSIGGFAEMLAGGYAGPLGDTQRDYVKAILESVDRLGLLIDDVLDVTQSEAGALPMAAAAVPLADLVREVAEAADAERGEDEVRITVRADPLAGSVEVDAARMSRALAEIARHAAARTPVGGRVCLSASGTSERAEVSVIDEGEMLDAREVARLFARFPERRGEGAPSRLAFARRIVEAHGGTVTAEPGETSGLTVRVELPRVMPHG